MRGFLIHRFTLLSACALFFGSGAAAQDADSDEGEPNSSSSTQSSKESAGEFDGNVDVVWGHDDNLFATKNEKVDDIFLLIQPSLNYSLGRGKNQLTLRGSGEVAFYDRNRSENYDDWLLGADGQLSLAAPLQLIAGGKYEWEHESRASPEDVAGSEPTQFRRAYGYLGLLGKAGRIAYRIGATINDYNFSDTPAASGIINNDDRDRQQFEIGARVGIASKAGPEFFVQGLWDRRDYRQKADDWGFRRDSSGYSIAAGVRHEITKRLSGEAFVGIMKQNYDDPNLPNVKSIDYGIAIDWTGQDSLGVSFKLDRSVEETTLPLASSYVLTSGSIGAHVQAGPRLAVGAGLSGAKFDYRGTPRSEFVIGANLWARYWLNRYIYLGSDYLLSQRASNAAGYDFDQNRLSLRVGVQLHPRYEADDVSSGLGKALDGFYLATLLGHGSLVTGLDGPRGTGTNTADFGDVDFAIGMAFGYAIVVRSVYLGAEAEAFGGGPDWLHDADRRFSVSRKGNLGASLRLGKLTSHGDLAYGRFGIVSTKFRTTYQRSDLNVDEKAWRTGLGFGLGLEAAVGSHGFVRTEYNLISYPDYDIQTGSGSADNFSNSENQFRMGLGLRFGGNRKREDDNDVPSFSSIYGGIGIGHGGLTSSNQGPRSGGFVLDVTRSGQGGFISAFAGIGAEFGGFYAGGELHSDAGHIDWNIERDPQGRIYSVEHDYSYGASLRIGHILSPSALLYGRAGVVRTRFDIRYATTGTSVRAKLTKTGFRYGTGLQVQLGSRSSMRLEYTFTEYPDFSIAYGHSADRFKNYENSVSMGIQFKFWSL